MTGHTTYLGIPYPNSPTTDPDDVPADLKAAVDFVDAAIGGPWTTYVPAVTVTYGTLAATAIWGRFKAIGKTLHLAAGLTTPAGGSGGNPILIGLPPGYGATGTSGQLWPISIYGPQAPGSYLYGTAIQLWIPSTLTGHDQFSVSATIETV